MRPRGMFCTVLSVVALLSLLGCQSSNNSTPQCIVSGNNNFIPTPGVGQWVAFGGNEPPINGDSFNFPYYQSQQVAGYFYTQLPTAPTVGQTLTLTYDVIGNNPFWLQADRNDTNPPTLHLFIWQKGDNLSCQGDLNFYRLFARAQTPLVLGSGQTISAPLSGASWQGCYPNQVVTDARLQSALNNALGFGVVFGGQYFDGHAVCLGGGSARFYIRGLSVN